MKGKINGKMKGVLLIAVFLLTTLSGIAFIPTVSAATAITPDYIFSEVAPGTAAWSTIDQYSGSYSALLKDGGQGWPSAGMVRVPVNILLSEITSLSYWFKYDNPDAEFAENIPAMSLFIDTTGDGEHDYHVALTSPAPGFAQNTWVQWDLTTSGWDEWHDSRGEWDLTLDDVKAYVAGIQTVPAVVVSVNIGEGGWGSGSFTENTAYVDDIEINGDVYELEPQSITAGETYDISWSSAETEYANKDVTLLYDPEEEVTPIYVADIEQTIPTSSEGVVNFYNIVPHYAGNWTISYLNNVPTTPMMDETGLVKMSMIPETDHLHTTYFLVQPAEDYDVIITSSALDVESGTVALQVTVTSEGEPVKDAYVSVEFWDNEATHLDTDDTAVLIGYVIQTISTGIATFDIEVPEVAGTIYVTAGTDLGPEDEDDTDDQYFEHWGYKTIPVSAISAIDITVSPTTYMMGIPYNLVINLENAIDDINVLGASTKTNSVNVTLEGDDFEGSITSAGLTDITIDKVYADGIEISGFPYAIPTGTEELVIQGHTASFAQADEVAITIVGFEANELGVITVSAGVDIGGVYENDLYSLSDPDTPDLMFDYTETSAKTISVSEPGDINFVGLSHDEIAATADATLTFTAYYYDGIDTDLATGFVVTLVYPSGITYEGTTDGSTGVFTASLLSGTEPYWADEAGNMTITVSGTVGEDEYSGTITIPVTGYLVSTDTETIVVLEETDVTITVTNGTDLVINNAIVTLTADLGTLTATEMDGIDVEIDGTVTSISDGLYVFHDVNASQVSTITVLVETVAAVKMARLEIAATNPVLTVTSTNDTLTSIIDNVFTIRVMDGATPESGADIELNVTFTADPEDKKTNSSGYSEVTILSEYLPSTVDAVRVYVVSSDVAETGVLILPVAMPVYQENATFSLTAGLDSYGNFTLMSAGGEPGIILVDEADDTNAATVHASAHLAITDTTTDRLADVDMTVANGYAWFMLGEAASADTLVKVDELNITAQVATGSQSVLVKSIPIYNPIVSNSTSYSGFPVTYTAYVGQSTDFYIKIQDASGEPVEGAEVEIFEGLATGITDVLGETTITWTPSATGTYDLHLNDVLFIGNITVVSYVAPQLVIDYTPETVYLDDTVIVSVTADSEPVAFVSVTIVNPDGVLIERMTTNAGTATFTADALGTWSISVTKTDYVEDSTTVEVVPSAQPDLPAETTDQEPKDSSGVPKTSFVLGETVLASSTVTNTGPQTQSMVIIVQWTDPDLRALAPVFLIVELDAGDDFTYAPGLIIPTTGYATGTWTATIMVLTDWPANGGVTIGVPVTITITVS